MKLRAHLGALILGTLLPMVAFSALVLGWVQRQTSVVIPVREERTSRYALGAVVTAAALVEILRQEQLPPDRLTTLTDRAGIIIAQTREGDQLVGQQASPDLVAAMTARPEGSSRGLTKDGVGNLVTNAIQAMPDGGTLRIETRSSDGDVLVAVADSGAGISSGYLEKIFEPLFTTKARGIGLGLAVTKNLGEANGGEITATSARRGRGVTSSCDSRRSSREISEA